MTFQYRVWKQGDRFTRRGGYVHLPCDAVAAEVNDKPECHSCSDWSGCGGDCTLSELICPTCGERKAM